MNALGKDLKIGQYVVLKSEILREEFQSLDWRTVEVVGDMFGNFSFTSGTAILVKFKDGEVTRMSGLDIEGLATDDIYLQKVNEVTK